MTGEEVCELISEELRPRFKDLVTAAAQQSICWMESYEDNRRGQVEFLLAVAMAAESVCRALEGMDPEACRTFVTQAMLIVNQHLCETSGLRE